MLWDNLDMPGTGPGQASINQDNLDVPGSGHGHASTWLWTCHDLDLDMPCLALDMPCLALDMPEPRPGHTNINQANLDMPETGPGHARTWTWTCQDLDLDMP